MKIKPYIKKFLVILLIKTIKTTKKNKTLKYCLLKLEEFIPNHLRNKIRTLYLRNDTRFHKVLPLTSREKEIYQKLLMNSKKD